MLRVLCVLGWSEWPCVSRLCVLHVLCMLGCQRFVVRSVNGVIVLFVRTPLYHLKVSCFCVRGDPARGTFTNATVLTDDSKLLP